MQMTRTMMSFSGLHVLQLALTAAYCRLATGARTAGESAQEGRSRKRKVGEGVGRHFRFSLSVSACDASAGFTLSSPDRRR